MSWIPGYHLFHLLLLLFAAPTNHLPAPRSIEDTQSIVKLGQVIFQIIDADVDADTDPGSDTDPDTDPDDPLDGHF